MSHPLEHKIAALRGRLWRLLAAYGLSRIAAVVLAAVIVLGLTDYLVRFQDRGIRLIASLVVLSLFCWTWYRYLYITLATRFRDVELARRVERRFPALGDELASALEFLDQAEDDPTAGSVALRRRVIARATAATERIDFRQAIRRGPALRMAVAASALGLLAAMLVVVDPLSSQIAVARLVYPFGRSAWHHLALVKPVTKVARGQTFEVAVADALSRPLPSKVRIHYRFEDPAGTVTEETELMQLVEGTMLARRQNVTRPFSYRVEGGDDNSMPWIAVEVLEPPALEWLSIDLLPPQYTGWATEKTQGDIRALVGTRLAVSARSTKPLQAAALCLGLKEGRRITGKISDDERTFHVPASRAREVLLDELGEYDYWFELTDLEGPHAGENTRWLVHAVPDEPPSVSIEQPTATLFVTPEAVVPLKIVAKDDLAVRAVSLRFSRSDRPDQAEAELLLEEGTSELPPHSGSFSSRDESGRLRAISYLWHLAPLALPPSTQVTFHAAATDYRPQSGGSQPCRLVVITPEELADRIASRQAFVLAELARVLEMQRQSRGQVADLEIQFSEVGHLDQVGVDHVRGAELNQRQVNHTLASDSEGVPMHIAGLLADLDNNKVDSPDIKRQMEHLLDEIDRLAREHLPIIGRELTAAIKAATVRLQDPPPATPGGAEEDSRTESRRPDAAVAGPLAAAGKQQDEVIASLERILGRLSRWDDFRRFHRQVGQLLRDQQDLSGKTRELARRTLTKELKDLSPQESAEAKIIGRMQLELARRLDGIQQQMKQSLDQADQSDPLVGETVSDALERVDELAITSKMHAAAASAEGNRMGRAITEQEHLIEDLEEVLDILANRREHELARLIKKLREAEADLADLSQREAALRQRMHQAVAKADGDARRELARLGQQQEQLQHDTERIQRRLERLMAERTAQITGQAAEQMGQAARSAGAGEGRGASQRAGEAKEKLDQAARQLAQRRRQAEFQLASEQLATLQDNLKSMKTRQENAINETQRLDRLRQEHGHLTEAQDASLRQLAREQQVLQSTTKALVEQLAAAKVFTLALSEAANRMSQAALMLQRSQTGTPTQQHQQAARDHLGQILEALKPDEQQQAGDSSAGQGGQTGQAAAPGDAIRVLAELKLLKLMQEEINRHTRQLEEQFGPLAKLPGDARQRYLELSHKQGLLADLLLNLIPVEQSTNNDLDGLPDGEHKPPNPSNLE